MNERLRFPSWLACALLVLAACDDDQSPAGDAGKDAAMATHDAGCTAACKSSTGGPPVNACLVVDHASRCVFTCTSDADCLAPFYGACSGLADDGSKICGDAVDGGSGDGGPTPATDAGPAEGCTGSGGSVVKMTCCTSVTSFPDTCAIGACGCAPASSHEVDACECPVGTCFDGTACN